MTRRLLIALALIVLTSASTAAHAKVVRGGLYRLAANGQQFAAQGIPVRVTNKIMGPSSFAYSDQTGMYYLYNVPAGDYVLQIWLTNDERQAMTFPLRVGSEGVVNIPRIRVP